MSTDTTHPTEILVETDAPAITITRVFDAPRELVFRAATDPALVVRWLGPRDLVMTVDHWDPRSNGSYRYVHRGVDRELEAWFHGVFHLVRAPELVIQTFEFEGWPDVPALETARFEDVGGGRTSVVRRAVFPDTATRDAMVESGMERGVRDGDDRLAELLVTL